MNRYLDIAFRSKLRLLVFVLFLPLALSSINFYFWRSYTVSEVVWVGDLGPFGQSATDAVSYNHYMSAAQNATLRLSNLLANKNFGNAVGDQLMADGVIETYSERVAVIASLTKLTIGPGSSPTASSAGPQGGDFGPDHLITIGYSCTVPAVCGAVVADVLAIFRAQYAELKTREAEIARGIYRAQLKTVEASVAAATTALQKYDAAQPKKAPGESADAFADPARTVLQGDLDEATKQLAAVRGSLVNIETSLSVANGITSNMYVVDGPTIQSGLYGIGGFRVDNLKSDAIIWFCCVAAAVAYLILVAFLDRTVRDPEQIRGRLQKPVVAIPAH